MPSAPRTSHFATKVPQLEIAKSWKGQGQRPLRCQECFPFPFSWQFGPSSRPPDVNLLCLRHSMVQIGCRQSSRRSGCSFTVFVRLLNPAIDMERAMPPTGARALTLEARDPISRLQVDTSLSTFADDVPYVTANCRLHTNRAILGREPGRLSWAVVHGPEPRQESSWYGSWAALKWLRSALTVDAVNYFADGASEFANIWTVCYITQVPLCLNNFQADCSCKAKLENFAQVLAHQRRCCVASPVGFSCYGGFSSTFLFFEALQTHKGDNSRLEWVVAAIGRKCLQGKTRQTRSRCQRSSSQSE